MSAGHGAAHAVRFQYLGDWKTVLPLRFYTTTTHFPRTVICVEPSVVSLVHCRNAGEPVSFVCPYGIVGMDIDLILLAQRKTDLFLSIFLVEVLKKLTIFSFFNYRINLLKKC